MPSNSGEGAAQAAPTPNELAKQIKAANAKVDRSELSHALEVGALLLQAKPQIPKGQWEIWVREKLAMPRNRSARCMRLASNVSAVIHCKTVVEADAVLRRPSKPRPQQDKPPKRKPREAGKRLRELRQVDEGRLLNARISIMKMVGILEGIDLPELDLHGADPDTVTEIYEELSILAKWLDQSLDVVAVEMDDLRKAETIGKLRENMNGRTPAEVATAERLAARLERKRHALRR